LVTGYSNIAVNNIMAGLLKHGVKALRVGHGHGMDNNTLQVGLLLASVCNVA